MTDAEIRKAAESGARSLDQLRDSLGVGANCGCCLEVAQAIINEGCAHRELAQALSYAA